MRTHLTRLIPWLVARSAVARWHRHLAPPPGHKFSIGLYVAGELRGVAIVGRPVSRRLAETGALEVTRVATDGVPNGCSALYGASWREARRRGVRRLVTYTRADEPGTSLRAAGWRAVHVTKVESWLRSSRRRQLADLLPKIR